MAWDGERDFVEKGSGAGRKGRRKVLKYNTPI